MTKQDLLKPRYLITADYPNSTFPVGEIIVEKSRLRNKWFETEKSFINRIVNPYKYPAIFKPLEWWEMRKEIDLPLYLKVNTEKSSLFNGSVHKVREIGKYEYTKEQMDPDASELFVRIVGRENIYRFNLCHFLPATIEEYNEYTSRA